MTKPNVVSTVVNHGRPCRTVNYAMVNKRGFSVTSNRQFSRINKQKKKGTSLPTSPVDESVQIQVGHNHGNCSALTGEVTPQRTNHLHTPMNMTDNRCIDTGKQSANATTISVIDRVETENRLKSLFLSSQN